MPQDYVYLPVWLVVVLVFLASGAVQYALIGAVKLVLRLTREHNEPTHVEKPAIILLEDYRKVNRSE